MYRSLLMLGAFIFSFAQNAIAQCNVQITSPGNQICLGSSMILTASPAGANTYQWYENGNAIGTNADTVTVSPNTNSIYTVEATYGTCTTTSPNYNISVQTPPVLTVTSNNPVCGGTLMLSVTPGGGTYQWVGPNGYASVQQNPMIANIMPSMSGQYCVSVNYGACVVTECINVSITGVTPVTATNNGPVCIGDTLQLSATTITGATYSWSGPGGYSSTQQNPSIIVDNNTLGGVYSVIAYDNICPNYDSTQVAVCNTFDVAIYTDVNNSCINEPFVDGYPYLGSTIKIDSNGVNIDTIQATAGFYYTAYGNAGDIYNFELISLPAGVAPSCPTTGIVSYTLQNYAYNDIDFGLICDNTNPSNDLGIYISNPNTIATQQSGHIYITNASCNNTTATVTLVHSPKYQYSWGNMVPSSVSGNTVTWELNNVPNYSFPSTIHYVLTFSQNPLLANDTTHSHVSVGPTTNDINLANNTAFKIDTVIASLDPNAITAFPAECVTAGTNMQYMIQFENIGNAPAENIYVLDTLPAELEVSTMELVMSSHNMYVTKIQEGGYNIIRFDFPNINLPDSSNHAECHGMLVYTIDLNSALPYGAEVFHKAGIYFDYNTVVMTNNERSSICVPQNVSTTTKGGGTILYPNPAGDELTVQTDGTFTNATITNSIGQVILEQSLDKKQQRINISSLAAGMYYINISGAQGSEVLKFVKM